MKFIIWMISAFTIVSVPVAHAISAEGHKIMVSGPSPWAIDVAREIYGAGGNVVDVAVAVAFSLSVTHPYYGALGGGGFAMVKMDGPVQALDFRETAPSATAQEFYKDAPPSASITGGKAVGVPGVPAGLWALHQRYGKLKWSQVVSPAEALANKGFRVSGEWVRSTHKEHGRFTAGGREAFLKPGGVELKPGELLQQPQLAAALKLVRLKNRAGFYDGPVAHDLVAAVRSSGGVMTLEDLAHYQPRWLQPLTTQFAGRTIDLMPPPSSGGMVIWTALQLMERLKLTSVAALSVDELHLLAEIEARAFRGRSLLGDPDFFKNPLDQLTAAPYLDRLAHSISLKKSTPLPPINDREFSEHSETTHFSVMDKDGHAVAMTVTLNGYYGSAVVSSKFHIALNNEMDDFTTHADQPNMYGLTQGMGNSVEAGKRPLSSMSPTLVEKDGQVVMAVGAPGGPRIISAVLQVLYRAVGRGESDLDWAIQAPRVHHQFSPHTVYVDMGRFSPEILQGLRDRGHVIEESQGMAKGYAVRLRPDGILEGAFDARGEGAAGGI